jgi:hypothetical protein
MEQFKIRASASHKILTEARAIKDREGLGETAKTYCSEWLHDETYNRKKIYSSKYTDKGILNEDEAIDFMAKYLNLGLCFKNEEFFENEYFKGTPDVILSDYVIDVKNSWDYRTFPFFSAKINSDYSDQLQTYMILTGKKKSKLVYVLTNTPIHLIEAHVHSVCRRTGFEFDDLIDDFIKEMTYDDIPDELKIKVYEIEKDPLFEGRLIEKVLKSREYIDELLKSIK